MVTLGAEEVQPRRTGLSLEYDDGDSVWVPQLTGKLWSPSTCEHSSDDQIQAEHGVDSGGWASARSLMRETLSNFGS